MTESVDVSGRGRWRVAGRVEVETGSEQVRKTRLWMYGLEKKSKVLKLKE